MRSTLGGRFQATAHLPKIGRINIYVVLILAALAILAVLIFTAKHAKGYARNAKRWFSKC